jgi:hypothetical protein
MKNVAASNRIGSWQSATTNTHDGRPQDAWHRYVTARAVVARLSNEVQALIDRARAAGFNASEALAIPAIRQALAAARQALRELGLARALIAS